MALSPKNIEVAKLSAALQEFSREREWQQFHTPKNLVMALSVEVAEIVEIFQWLTPAQSQSLSQKQRANLEDEIGDVMIYLTMLATQHDLDPLVCAQQKIVKNSKKYPHQQVRGKAKKYSEY